MGSKNQVTPPPIQEHATIHTSHITHLSRVDHHKSCVCQTSWTIYTAAQASVARYGPVNYAGSNFLRPPPNGLLQSFSGSCHSSPCISSTFHYSRFGTVSAVDNRVLGITAGGSGCQKVYFWPKSYQDNRGFGLFLAKFGTNECCDCTKGTADKGTK